MVRRWAPGIAALEASAAAPALRAAVTEATSRAPAVLVLEDVEALAPREDAKPISTVLLDVVSRAVAAPGVAVVCTAPGPRGCHRSCAGPGGWTTSCPCRCRTGPAGARCSTCCCAPPAVLRRAPGRGRRADARLRGRRPAGGAPRGRGAGGRPAAGHADADDRAGRPARRAGWSSRPRAESTVDVPTLSLADVGDMARRKQALTETVLWPLSHPDSFARLGVQPARGVLLYGPPGCGKTYLVRALAGTGQRTCCGQGRGAAVEVGRGERAGVRDLFRRARDAAPALVFLDEVDALAPIRGQSTDSGVTDRVVAALLTEMDGMEGLRDVVVIGATNRPDLVDPALLRPGRMERLMYVPPPDAAARTAILRATARNTPLAADVDLDAVGRDTDGFSAADLHRAGARGRPGRDAPLPGRDRGHRRRPRPPPGPPSTRPCTRSRWRTWKPSRPAPAPPELHPPAAARPIAETGGRRRLAACFLKIGALRAAGSGPVAGDHEHDAGGGRGQPVVARKHPLDGGNSAASWRAARSEARRRGCSTRWSPAAGRRSCRPARPPAAALGGRSATRSARPATVELFSTVSGARATGGEGGGGGTVVAVGGGLVGGVGAELVAGSEAGSETVGAVLAVLVGAGPAAGGDSSPPRSASRPMTSSAMPARASRPPNSRAPSGAANDEPTRLTGLPPVRGGPVRGGAAVSRLGRSPGPPPRSSNV